METSPRSLSMRRSSPSSVSLSSVYCWHLVVSCLILVISISVCIASSAAFAYSINTSIKWFLSLIIGTIIASTLSLYAVSQVITNAKKRSESYNERMKSLNNLMVNRAIGKHLQMRVRKYMEFLQYSDEHLTSSSKDLDMLPLSIKQDFQIDMYG